MFKWFCDSIIRLWFDWFFVSFSSFGALLILVLLVDFLEESAFGILVILVLLVVFYFFALADLCVPISSRVFVSARFCSLSMSCCMLS